MKEATMNKYQVTITYMDSKVETLLLDSDIAWSGHQYIAVTKCIGTIEKQELVRLFIPMANVRNIESFKIMSKEPV